MNLGIVRVKRRCLQDTAAAQSVYFIAQRLASVRFSPLSRFKAS
jgi:hypothetical protein